MIALLVVERVRMRRQIVKLEKLQASSSGATMCFLSDSDVRGTAAKVEKSSTQSVSLEVRKGHD